MVLTDIRILELMRHSMQEILKDHKFYVLSSIIPSLLGIFTLKGKVISKDQHSLENLQVEAYDDDLLLKPDDFLGDASTDSHGIFKIDFDESKFRGTFEFLEGTPDVYLLIKDNQGSEILRTKIMQTKKEIEYHIRIADNTPNPNAIDIYSGNAQRVIRMLREVGDMIGLEYRISQNILNNGNPPQDVRDNLQNFVSGYQERNSNLDLFSGVISSLVDSFSEELRIGSIGYDGPQVPRMPRRERYDQVIIWPRQEEFKWA